MAPFRLSNARLSFRNADGRDAERDVGEDFDEHAAQAHDQRRAELCVAGDAKQAFNAFDLFLHQHAFDVGAGFFRAHAGEHFLIGFLDALLVLQSQAQGAQFGLVRDIDGGDFEHAGIAELFGGTDSRRLPIAP